MRKVLNIHRPWAKKTSSLIGIASLDRQDTINLNKIKGTADLAKEVEDWCAKMVNLSGKVKRACKDIHVLIEKGCYESNNAKKEKYADQINRKIRAIQDKTQKWESEVNDFVNLKPQDQNSYWDGYDQLAITKEMLGYLPQDDDE